MSEMEEKKEEGKGKEKEEEEEEEEVILDHFYHQHPLTLTKSDMEYEQCYGCRRFIVSGETVYMCRDKCSWSPILHEECAEMPREIRLLMHPQHTLIQRAMYNYPTCAVCESSICRIGYYCSSPDSCSFNIHVGCAPNKGMLKRHDHPSHPHQLTLLWRPGRSCLSRCDACGTIERGNSYSCIECEYWIHESCADLPATADYRHLHHHPLSLAFYVPQEYLKFNFPCYICFKEFLPKHWVYHCGICRYVAHIKCAIKASPANMNNIDTNAAGNKDVITFPVNNAAEDLIGPFVTKVGGAMAIPHDNGKYKFHNHDHELSLISCPFHDEKEQKEEEEYWDDDDDDLNLTTKSELICDGCTTPIYQRRYHSSNKGCNYYLSCGECKYFLHWECFHLPHELPSHPFHPIDDHNLILKTPPKLNTTYCHICGAYTNGLIYKCTKCSFEVDMKCACLPDTIKHAAHPHHHLKLLSREITWKRSYINRLCGSCGVDTYSEACYKCGICEFIVHSDCVQKLLTEKTGLEEDIRILNEKLSSALSDCNAKDNIVKKQVKIAEEAISGWEKAETEAITLKQEVDKVLQQKAFAEERIEHLDAALKECMQQLRFVREEQERRVHDAVTKTSEEFEKIRIALDEQLVEASKKFAKLDAENNQLSKALSGKDKVIEDLSKYRSQVEADLNSFLSRVESTEKENASLKYEVHVLEKELDIRNEEREFNRRIADAAQKQQQESAKKIATLETECQRLRFLVQKRLPCPASLAKMRSEVKSLAKDNVEMRKRKSNPSPTTELVTDVPSEKITLLTEQLYTMVEENTALKEALNKKSSELQVSRNMYARTSSKFSQSGELGKLCYLQEHSLAASSDVGSEDKFSCTESWTSSLISELEHSKNGNFRTLSHRTMATSDMNLMDDFAEMEKLAVISLDDPAESPDSSCEESNAIIGSPRSPSGAHSSSEPGRGCAPINGCPSENVISSQEIHSGCVAGNGIPERLGDLLKMLLEHSHLSQRNPQDLLEDIKLALAHQRVDSAVFCGKTSTNHAEASSNKSSNQDAPDMRNGNNIPLSNTEQSDHKSESNVSIPIRKVLELLEGINIQSQDNGLAEFSSGKDEKILSYKNSGNPTGYIVRVFQWKTAELFAILQQFVQTCNDLLNGTANLEQFALQIASSLEWIMSHCFSIQDVSSMKDAIRNHLDWDDSGSESEEESESVSRPHNSSSQMEAVQLSIREEVKIWNVEWESKESTMTGSEGFLHSETCKSECFIIQPQESKDDAVEQIERKFEHRLKNQKMIKEDLENQLGESNQEWRKACERISHLENELENRNNCCKTLEETCHELQIQLNSMTTSRGVPDNGKQSKHQQKQLSNDWEISAASEKLAECQETILNLGKQLKALASPCDAALFDKVISAPAEPTVVRNISRRSSLLNKMLAEDNDTHGAAAHNENNTSSAATESSAKSTSHEQKSKTAAATMDIVPSNKHGGTNFFKRLFSRRKRGKHDKTPIS